MRVLFAVLLLLAYSSTIWASADCKEPNARYEDIGCASEALDNADKKLNATYKALLASLDQEGRGKLKEAQRA